MKPASALVVENLEIAPALFMLWLEAPAIRQAAQPGQFWMVLCGEGFDPYLPRPFSHSGTRSSGRGTAQHALLIRVVGRGSGWLSRRRPGDVVTVLGPLGRALTIGASTRNLLLVGHAAHVAPLLATAAQAAGREVNVALVRGAAPGVPAVPAEMLPPEVEFVSVNDDEDGEGAAAAATDYLQWADEVLASGPEPLLRRLSAELKRLSLRRAVQAIVWEQLACGTGICGGCGIETRRHGWRLVCRDGPRFELNDLY